MCVTCREIFYTSAKKERMVDLSMTHTNKQKTMWGCQKNGNGSRVTGSQ